MLTLMKDVPENVLGVVAEGMVTAHDYETVLIPAVEERLEKQDKVRVLYVTAADFQGYDAGAMWDDAKLGLSHLTAWERVAVVSDVEWIRMMLHAFSFMMMGRMKLFKIEELEQAKVWVAE
ncbi:MAG: STAS/SEC14 domain-containing protein [Rhodospirillales bacterium]|nr:STAS/SEC14 domain-containing protein [Rhodospirillales bacterium]